MAKDRANDPKRKFSMPSPIGMGALVGFGDFEREAQRKAHHAAEESIVDKHGDNMEKANAEVKKYREKHGY